MPDPDLSAEIDRVTACGPIRAWSVIVTVLGDLCRLRDDRISARLLNRLIAPMGISGQAARVAIHRLKRDGWIETERRGRESFYRLSDKGWDETQAVWPIVYGRDPPDTDASLLIGPPDMSPSAFTAALPGHAVLLAPRTAMIAGDTMTEAPEWLQVPIIGGALPGWVRDLIADGGLLDDYAALIAAVTAIAPVTAPSADTASLRLIILHHWRRLCLRHGGLPDALLPTDWTGARARIVVLQALDQLPRPPLADLAKAAEGPGDPDGNTAQAAEQSCD